MVDDLATNKRNVMETYRKFILGCKKKYGTARSQVHYRDYIQAYLVAKRWVIFLERRYGVDG
jgi:hypothetical protein